MVPIVPKTASRTARPQKNFTDSLLQSGNIKVEQTEVDRYGRVVGIVIISDSINLNERLLQAGLAWHYSYFDKNPEWAAFELNAKKDKAGL